MDEDKKQPRSEQRSELRWRAMLFASVVMLAMAGGYLLAAIGQPSPFRADNVLVMAVILVAACQLGLRATTSSSLVNFLARDPALEDELVRANRASAARFGFWTLMLGAAVAFVAALFTPITVVQAAPLLVSAGAAVAGLRFAIREARGP